MKRSDPAPVVDTDALVLVTAADCHLCVRARDVLGALGIEAREVDIASAEAQAHADAGLPLAFLPVLTDGRRVIGYGRLSEKRLRRDLGL